jgi:hypothetical protein
MGLLLLLAMTGCTYLVEQRDLPEQVEWSGYVYAGVPADDVPLLEDGTIEILDRDGAALADAEARQDYENTLGYWTLDVPVDTEVALRLSGADVVSTLWLGTTPTGNGYWLGGALYARGVDETAELFDALDGYQGLSPQELSDGEIAHLVGQPWDRDAVAGATWSATDGEGSDAAVVLLVADDEGNLSDAGTGPVDLIIAVNLAPGTVSLQVDADDGRTARAEWPAQGGDLVSAMWFQLPEESTP